MKPYDGQRWADVILGRERVRGQRCDESILTAVVRKTKSQKGLGFVGYHISGGLSGQRDEDRGRDCYLVVTLHYRIGRTAGRFEIFTSI